MAERALDAHRLQRPAGVEDAGHADDRVLLQELERHRRIVEFDGTATDLRRDVAGQRVDVDLETDGEGGLRAHTGPDAAERRALDRLMQLERVAPERLVAERVEPEDLS